MVSYPVIIIARGPNKSTPKYSTTRKGSDTHSYHRDLGVLGVLARSLGVVRGGALGEGAEDVLVVDLAEAGGREEVAEENMREEGEGEAERP